jgi:hypothetical protein
MLVPLAAARPPHPAAQPPGQQSIIAIAPRPWLSRGVEVRGKTIDKRRRTTDVERRPLTHL